ncbi:hypothetical protein ACI2LX_36095, partial [Streptomyces fungicidicus]|uniref:hypothetical protein n=1 Tax=Streptomyces fungicidicus TaxID=68203 RepID=UPI00384EA9BB
RHAAHDEENEEGRNGEDDEKHEGYDAPRLPWSLIGLACLPFLHRDVLVNHTYFVYAPVTARTPAPNWLHRRRPFTAELATVDCNSRKNE